MKSTGKIIYSPRSHLGSSEKWAILACDDTIQKYYRHLYTMEYPYLNGEKTGKLTRSVWGAHISWLRNENIPNYKLWPIDENRIIEFEYEPGVLDNSEYFWLKVKCPRLEEIRKLYGLHPYPKFGYHLTIGRIAND